MTVLCTGYCVLDLVQKRHSFQLRCKICNFDWKKYPHAIASWSAAVIHVNQTWSRHRPSLPLCRVSLPVPVSIEWTKPSNRESSFRITLTCFPMCSMWRFYGYTAHAETLSRAKNTTGCIARRVKFKPFPENIPYIEKSKIFYFK